MLNLVYSYILDMICKHKSTKLDSSKYCYVSPTSDISLNTVKWSNSSILNYSIWHTSKLNGSKYCSVSLTNQLNISNLIHTYMIKQFFSKQFSLAQVICSHSVEMGNSSIWTISCSFTLGQSVPGCDGNERVLHIPQSMIRWFSTIYRTLVAGGVLLFCRDAVSVFYSPSQLGSR